MITCKKCMDIISSDEWVKKRGIPGELKRQLRQLAMKHVLGKHENDR